MLNYKTSIILIALLVLTAGSVLMSCSNPFGSNDGPTRFTPQIKNLEVSRSSVFCGREFEISFDYHDPQEDIIIINLLLIGEDNPGLIIDAIGWDSTELVDLTTEEGRAIIDYTIDCDLDSPNGRYTLRVSLDDEKGHTSNELYEELRIF